MRRLPFRLLLLFVLLLFLFSCAADKRGIAELCKHLKNLEDRKYIAHITAIFPKREVSFSLDYRFSVDGDDRVTVISPEEISGVAFSVPENDSTLEFDGIRLFLGSVDDFGTSPLSAMPQLLSVWRSGNYDEALSSDMFGEDAFLMIYRNRTDGKDLEYRTWFSEKDFFPLYAEIYNSGIRIIECKFERMR